MKLVIVRHAVTAETGHRLSGHTPDIPLSPAGRDAATAVAADLAQIEFGAVYSSPIERCRETATILAAPHGRRPRSLKALIEVDYGDWTGRTLKSLYRLKAWKRLMREPESFRFPGGESLDEVRKRVVALVHDLAARQPADSILAVSHSDVIRSLIADATGDSVARIHRFYVAPLGITVIDIRDGGPALLSVVNAPRLHA